MIVKLFRCCILGIFLTIQVAKVAILWHSDSLEKYQVAGKE
jgi:hypothetical protein